MGPKQSGKSFIIDTVLNLSCSQGNQVLLELLSSPQYMAILAKKVFIFGQYRLAVIIASKSFCFNAAD